MRPHRHAKSIAVLVILAGAPVSAENLSFYGTGGLIDTPSAEMLPDGTLALTSSLFGPTSRNTLTFQIMPRVQGSFRYGTIDNFFGPDSGLSNPALFDRSFDIHFQLLREADFWPAVTVGLRDFGGTGIYSSEFIVATKAITPDIIVTGGLGWGRLGERDGFESPFGSSFQDRDRNRGVEESGQLSAGNWFKGDVAPFAGIEWRATENLTLLAEYSSDLYSRETDLGLIDIQSPLNLGLKYHFDNGINIGAYYLYGSEIGAQVDYTIDPRKALVTSGSESAPQALLPRASVAAASWNQPNAATSVQQALGDQLAYEGLTLVGFSQSGRTATAQVINTRFGAEAQAIGRAMRIMANTLPPDVATLNVVFVDGGIPLSSQSIARADLEALEFAVDGAAQTLQRVAFEDGAGAVNLGIVPDATSPFRYDFGLYLTPSYFDPDSPIRAELGATLTASYSPAPGIIFAGQLRQPIVGNIDDATRRSNSVIQRVRTDIVRYAAESDLELAYLTAEYFFRPGPDLFGRTTVGYLERMYGGASAELLWYPIDSPLALGVEVNYARQRDFDIGFGFQDYDVVTGHASAYYDFGGDFHGQLDVGRYLAGDWGATVSLDRVFDNGFTVGAFATLTDVSFEDFGEGAFDKGIRIEIPLSWFTGQPSRQAFQETIRPVLRDGGARLSVRNRLYDLTRDYRGPSIDDQWGRFWR